MEKKILKLTSVITGLAGSITGLLYLIISIFDLIDRFQMKFPKEEISEDVSTMSLERGFEIGEMVQNTSTGTEEDISIFTIILIVYGVLFFSGLIFACVKYLYKYYKNRREDVDED